MYRRHLLLALCTLVLLFSSPAFSAAGGVDHNTQNIIFDSLDQSILPLEQIINRNIGLVDQNNDKIADYLSDREGTLDLLVMFQNFEAIPQYTSLPGIDIVRQFGGLPVVQMQSDASMLEGLAKVPGVTIIEENLPAHSTMAYSTSQLHVRESAWAQGLTGSTDFSVAVLDTGIDWTHSAFDGRVLATYNALNSNSTPAYDYDGHGSHVAGIVAGLPVTTSTFTQTARGELPDDTYFIPEILLANVNETSSITVGMDWGAKGEDSSGTARIYLVNSGLTFAQDSQSSGAGYFTTTFTGIPPGDYYVGFGSDSGAAGQPYEGWATITQDTEIPDQLLDDPFPSHAGVAYSTNIVGVKVLDDEGAGFSDDLIDGINWVINNKDEFNITVANLSLGFDTQSSIIDSYIASLANAGIVPVIAAGNDGAGSGIFSPGSAPEGITVGALNRYNEIAYYSSSDKNSAGQYQNAGKPDVLAPGGSYSSPANGYETSYDEGYGLIVSVDSNTVGFNQVEDDLVGYQGTSMAAPHIAGLAALLSQRYDDIYGYSWDLNTVYRIKRAILAGTFEVANIGYAGGEYKSGSSVDPTPSVSRTTKDYYEGWGASSAEAALGALSSNSAFGQFIIDFSLEDPFVANAKSWTLFAKAGTSYEFSASIPDGADLDLLVFDANSGANGDLSLLYSSVNASKTDASNDEQLFIKEGSNKELILVARLVDSDNAYDSVDFTLSDPNFIPNIRIENLVNGSVYGGSSFELIFSSASGKATAYLDDVDKGEVFSGDTINGLTEGLHNLTLVEFNPNNGLSDRDQVEFTTDLTAPQLEENFSSSYVSAPLLIAFNASDNYGLSHILLKVDGNTVNSLHFEAGTTDYSGELVLDPGLVPFGTYTVGIELYDQGENSFISTYNDVVFNHSLYILPLENITFEYGDEIGFTWEADTTETPVAYNFSIPSLGYEQVSVWDGSNISISLSSIPLGEYTYYLTATTASTETVAKGYFSVVDTTPPEIIGPSSGDYDATEDQILEFTFTEELPNKLKLFVDESLVEDKSWNGDAYSLTVSGLPGENTTIEIWVEDSSGNNANKIIVISWEDLRDPSIASLSDVSFVEGEATASITWMWDEKFLSSVEVSSGADQIYYSETPTVSTYVFTQTFLNSLSPGEYTYTILIIDQGGNTAFDSFKITVETAASPGTTEPTLGFLSLQGYLMTLVLLPVIYIARKKRS